MRRTQTAIIISSKTKQDQEKLQKAINTMPTLTAKDGTRTLTPMALLTSVQKGLEKAELNKRIRQENNDLDGTHGKLNRANRSDQNHTKMRLRILGLNEVLYRGTRVSHNLLQVLPLWPQ